MTGPGEGARLLALVDALAGRRVAVIGDLIADEFIYGEIARVSREAPVLILHYDSTDIVPGGAGNAAGNVAALGGLVRLAGLAGRDEVGRRLLATFKKRRIDVGAVVRPAGYRTPTKTRILAGGIHSAKQQVVRIDRAAAAAADDAARKAFASRVLRPCAAATRSSSPTTARAWSRRSSSLKPAGSSAGPRPRPGLGRGQPRAARDRSSSTRAITC
jgi:sugar/nucleoside kinase (ribokinase family)